MSSDTKTNLTVQVPDYTQGTTITTQYGMRFPDGTISWTTVSGSRGMESLDVRLIHEKLHGVDERWERTLKERAHSVRIDVDEYAEGHEIVKRLVILTTTDIEEA